LGDCFQTFNVVMVIACDCAAERNLRSSGMAMPLAFFVLKTRWYFWDGGGPGCKVRILVPCSRNPVDTLCAGADFYLLCAGELILIEELCFH
jgi:hypothetical protein